MVGGDFLSRPRPCMGCSAWEWVGEYLRVNLLEPGPRLMKKNLPGHGLTKVQKQWSRWMGIEPWRICRRTYTTFETINRHSNSIVFKSGVNWWQTLNVPWSRCRQKERCGWRPVVLLNFVRELLEKVL
jgi:hypothetical protein